MSTSAHMSRIFIPKTKYIFYIQANLSHFRVSYSLLCRVLAKSGKLRVLAARGKGGY